MDKNTVHWWALSEKQANTIIRVMGNVKLVFIPLGCHHDFSEEEHVYSRAAAKYQHLMGIGR